MEDSSVQEFLIEEIEKLDKSKDGTVDRQALWSLLQTRTLCLTQFQADQLQEKWFQHCQNFWIVARDMTKDMDDAQLVLIAKKMEAESAGRVVWREFASVVCDLLQRIDWEKDPRPDCTWCEVPSGELVIGNYWYNKQTGEVLWDRPVSQTTSDK